MYPEALAHLSCPKNPVVHLDLEPGAEITKDGSVRRGRLRCPQSTNLFRINGGIADLLGSWTLPDSPAQFMNYLPPTAWAYERAWRPHALSLFSGEPFGYDRELPLITRLMEPERGGLFLDVACSNGLYARALERARGDVPGHVIGLDHAMPMLRQARDFAHRDGLRISFARAKAQALPFAPASLAGVVMGGSLNEIGDANTALREIRRVLAPDGRCVLMNLVQATSMPGRTLQQTLSPGGIVFWSLDELNHRLKASGLRLRSQWRYGVVVFSLLVP